MVVVDAGASLNVPAPRHARLGAPAEGPPRDLDQRRLKAELIVDAFQIDGIDAMAVGGEDWALGSDWLRGMLTDKGAPVLAANLWCEEARPFGSSVVVERDGHRIGFVGVTLGDVEGCEVREPAAAARQAVAELGEVDLRVALVPALHDQQLATFLGAGVDVDVVIDARGMHTQGAPERRTNAWVVGAGTRGKQLGRLDLTWVDGGQGWAPTRYGDQLRERVARSEQRVAAHEAQAAAATEPELKQRFQVQVDAYRRQAEQQRAELERFGGGAGTHRLTSSVIALEKAMPEHAATRQRIDRTLDEIRALGTGSAMRAVLAGRSGFGDAWAGSDACATCHVAEHQQWSATPHARAWETLVHEKREQDSDCFSCHATGVGQVGGPETPVEAGTMRDVQCEACHGPAKAHVAAPGRVKPVRTPDMGVCTTCHDGDRDGGRFDFGTYLPRVTHGAER